MGAGLVGLVAVILIIVGAVKLNEAKETKKSDESGPRLMITAGAFCGAGALGIWHHDKVTALVHKLMGKKSSASLMGHHIPGTSRDEFQKRVAAAAANLRSSIELARDSSASVGGSSCAMNGGGHDAESASALAARASARISSFLAQQM